MEGNIILLLLVIGPMAAAIISYIIGRSSKSARDYFADVVTILEFAVIAFLILTSAAGGQVKLVIPDVCGMGLHFGLDGFRGVFATVTAFMWMMTTIFSKEYLGHARNRNRYYLFLLITLGAMMGVFLSDDLFTTFIFFEMMSMASYVCVVQEETDGALYAGGIYLAVAVIGGMVTLMGLFMLHHATGTLMFEEMLPACQAVFAAQSRWLYIAGGCILFGFGAKAGMFPLHVWLPLAHPVAPAPASALLSGIITKSGIFGVIIISSRMFLHNGYWGFVILMFGVVTMLLGGILAIFSIDLKRTLACSSMSQLGFIFVGIGMQCLLGEENALAVRGTMLHMFNHSNLKLVLFMAAGVVVMNLHKLDLNDIRGFGRKKPLLKYVFLMGSLGIGGIPLFNGYVSKTLIHESIVEYIELLHEHEAGATFAIASGAGAPVLFKVIEWLFIITGAMTVAYMTKLFIAVFVEENNDPAIQKAFDEKTHYCNKVTGAVLLITATILPVLGVLPNLTLNKLADMGQGFMFGELPAHAVHYFSWTNIKGGLYSIVIGAIIYIVLIRGFILVKEGEKSIYADRWPKYLDLLEYFYNPLVGVVLPGICLFVFRLLEYVLDGLIVLVRKTTHRQLQPKRPKPKNYIGPFILGSICNFVTGLYQRIRGQEKIDRDYVVVFAQRQEVRKDAGKIISASVSFSLVMFGIGIIISALYLFLS